MRWEYFEIYTNDRKLYSVDDKHFFFSIYTQNYSNFLLCMAIIINKMTIFVLYTTTPFKCG